MQFFIYFTRSEGQAPMKPPTPEGMAEMGKMMQEGMASGLIVATGQLGRETTHVTLEEGAVSVSDGPFMEGKELIPGFTIIEVETKEQAVDYCTRMRKCMGDGTLRMAPIHMGHGKK